MLNMEMTGKAVGSLMMLVFFLAAIQSHAVMNPAVKEKADIRREVFLPDGNLVEMTPNKTSDDKDVKEEEEEDREYKHARGDDEQGKEEDSPLEFTEMPEGCQHFAMACGRNASTMEAISNWNDVSAAFEMCCIGGDHKPVTCQSLAEEAFSNRKEAFHLSDQVCEDDGPCIQSQQSEYDHPLHCFESFDNSDQQCVKGRNTTKHPHQSKHPEQSGQPH